jgi:MFS family permease
MLGLVSLFTDMSSELVHSLLPVFMAGTLGASALIIGTVEGAAEGLALVVKVFSGYLSDVFGRRKPLVVLGYSLAALTKPLFPLAGSISWVLGARLLDRVGKGIRGAPRDALVADITPESIRGAAFGLRQALDTVGAIAGPALAIGFMLIYAGAIRTALWAAVVPGFIAVAILVFAVSEPDRKAAPVAARLPFSRAGLRSLGARYWRIVLVGALLTLARFTEAFLVLRASNLGLSNTWVPLVMIVMSLVYTLASYPAGKWSDSNGRRRVLGAGVVALLAADVVLALATDPMWLMAGVSLWGLHMGLTQGTLSTLIADVAPGNLRGTAFGVFNLVSGVVLLAGSAAAGELWDVFGAAAPFWAGAGLALLGLAAVLTLPKPAARS